ncbi:MAG: hypothetical protein R3D32_00615 [Nitratireductor sp.]
MAISNTALAGGLSVEEKAVLQASVFQHINALSIDGIIPHVDLTTGVTMDLVPTKAHPMILTMGGNFVLCTDFRDPQGQFVNVDFYIARVDTGFVVFQTEINNRPALENLMKAGKVAMMD